jgi:hypothetical protein
MPLVASIQYLLTLEMTRNDEEENAELKLSLANCTKKRSISKTAFFFYSSSV